MRAGVHGVKVPAACGDHIPAGVAGRAPTADGLALLAADGARLIAVNRWSNSLFVSHRSSGEDIQRRRGGPVKPAPSDGAIVWPERAAKLAHDTAVLLEARMTVAAHCRRWRLVALTLLALSVAGCGTIDLCDHSGLGDPPGGSSIPHTPR